jgi:tetratricopeptide (TPR) repeat protein
VKTAHTQVALGVLIIGLLCEAAWAQSPQPASDATVTTLREEDKPWNRGMTRATQDVAEALFLEGNRLFRVPLFAQAAAKYTAALRTWQHPAFYFNLALAQLNLGQDVAARDNLERALRYGDDPLGAAQFQEGQRQLRELETQLGKIRITCQTPGAVVTLDGVTLFTAPGSREAWVMPKTHEIAARKREYLSESRQVTVAPGALENLELKLITLEEAADANRRWATWKPWAVVGAGVAIAAGGGVFHLLSSQNEDQYGKEFLRLGCANTNDQATPGCQDGQIPPDLTDQLTRARRQQKVAIGSYIAGGSAVTVGAVLLALNRPRLAEQSHPSSSDRRVSVVPALSPEMFGVLISISP